MKALIFESSSRIVHLHADSVYTQPYDPRFDALAAFADSVDQITSDHRLSLMNLRIEEVDVYLVSLVADYQLKSGEITVEEGIQVWTLVPSSASEGWKITSIV